MAVRHAPSMRRACPFPSQSWWGRAKIWTSNGALATAGTSTAPSGGGFLVPPPRSNGESERRRARTECAHGKRSRTDGQGADSIWLYRAFPHWFLLAEASVSKGKRMYATTI